MSLTSKERRQRRAIKSRLHIRELGVARLTVHRTPRHIYAQVFDASGAKVGSVFAINDEVTGDQSPVDIQALPGGGFMAI